MKPSILVLTVWWVHVYDDAESVDAAFEKAHAVEQIDFTHL